MRQISFSLKTCLLFSSVFILSPSLSWAQSSTAPTETSSASVHTKQFDDWFYRCSDLPSQENESVQPKNAQTKPVRPNDTQPKTLQQCEVVQIQQVKQGDETVTVLSIAIALTAPTRAGQKPSLLMTSITPLNVYLPTGLRFSVENKDIFKMSYRNCNQAGCWAQQKLDTKVLTSLKKTNEATGHFRLVNGQNVNIKFSTKGLSNALNALEKGETLP